MSFSFKFFSLLVAQLIGFLFPFLTFLYLARILNPDGLGMYGIAHSFALWISIIIDFGFNYTGAREVASDRDSVFKIQNTLNSIISTKIMLIFLSVPLFFIIANFNPLLSNNPNIIISSIFYGISITFSFLWYLQGKEKFYLFSFIESFPKVISLILIYFLVSDLSDIWKIFCIQGFINYLFTFFTLFYLKYFEKVKFKISFKNSLRGLKIGKYFFYVRIIESIYTILPPFLMGFILNPSMIGIYLISEKIIRAFSVLILPVTRYVLPKMSYQINKIDDTVNLLFKETLKKVTIFFLFLSFFTITFSDQILLIFGNNYNGSGKMLKLFAFYPLFIALKSLLANQWLLANRMDFLYFKTIKFLPLFSFPFIVLAIYINIYYLPIIITVIEIIVIFLIFNNLRYVGLNPFKDISNQKN